MIVVPGLHIPVSGTAQRGVLDQAVEHRLRRPKEVIAGSTASACCRLPRPSSPTAGSTPASGFWSTGRRSPPSARTLLRRRHAGQRRTTTSSRHHLYRDRVISAFKRNIPYSSKQRRRHWAKQLVRRQEEQWRAADEIASASKKETPNPGMGVLRPSAAGSAAPKAAATRRPGRQFIGRQPDRRARRSWRYHFAQARGHPGHGGRLAWRGSRRRRCAAAEARPHGPATKYYHQDRHTPDDPACSTRAAQDAGRGHPRRRAAR